MTGENIKISVGIFLILILILLPVKSKDVRHWEVRPNGRTLPSPELIKELGFGYKKSYPYITLDDSIHFTITPHQRSYDIWDGKTL